jgi:hypothetical protein
MKSADFKLGMRVRRRSDDSSFVRDRRGHPQLKGRRAGIVVGLPERFGERHVAVAIQWEGSARVDQVLIHRLEPLAQKDQPIALGGTWQVKPGTLLTEAKAIPSA